MKRGKREGKGEKAKGEREKERGEGQRQGGCAHPPDSAQGAHGEGVQPLAGHSHGHPIPQGSPRYLVPLVGGWQLPVVGVRGQLPKALVGQVGLGVPRLHPKAAAHVGAALAVHQGESLGIPWGKGCPDLRD